MVSNYDAPVLYLADNCDIELTKPTESYLFLSSSINENDLKYAIERAIFMHKIDKKLKQDENNLSVMCEVVPIPYQSLTMQMD